MGLRVPLLDVVDPSQKVFELLLFFVRKRCVVMYFRDVCKVY